MNPNSKGEMPAMQLPTPMEQAPTTAPTGAETAPASPETASQPAAAAPVTVPMPVPAMPVGQASPPAATAGAAASVKDDSDLIEKEWVNKAKQIVEHTREDPYKQSEELTIFKADYMKQRYNKTIKLK